MTARLLLCTDLDRTLIPNGHAPESPGARESFRRLATHPEVCVAYVSGRDAGRIRAAIREYDLPVPNHVVADVGTSIYDIQTGNEWVRNHSWETDIGKDWGDSGHDRLARELSSVPFLRLQEGSKQNRFKLSFYFPADISEAEIAHTIGVHLTNLAIPVTLVLSIDEPNHIGLLDILPERASKLHAIEFLMQNLGFGIDQTVFCGDSGNDLNVLASRVPGVLVANASEPIRRRALRLAEKNGNAAYLYIAKGSFMRMNGNYAAGILEGVCHFYPDAARWISGPSAPGTIDPGRD